MEGYVICCEYRKPRAQAVAVPLLQPVGTGLCAGVISLDRDLLPETAVEGMEPEGGSFLLGAVVEWHAADSALLRGLRDFFSIIEPMPPDAAWEPLGYDVCEQYAYSLLLERRDGILSASGRLQGAPLNRYGLLDDRATAVRYAESRMGPDSSDVALVVRLYRVGVHPESR